MSYLSKGILKVQKAPSGEYSPGSEFYHYGSERKYTNVKYDVDGQKHPIDIIEFSRREKNYSKIKHPTKKPVALFEYLIKTYTNEGDIVLDNCAGSGTTALACLHLKRDYVVMEKETEYVNLINSRIQDFHQEEDRKKEADRKKQPSLFDIPESPPPNNIQHSNF